MAIIGKIRKHSGLAVIIIGVAIAAFVIGDFGKKRNRGTTEIGSVDKEVIPYVEFNAKVEENINIQKENSKSDKITDAETFSIRQSTWTAMVKDMVLGNEYDKLGLSLSPEELFDQVQGKNPHRYILQYFKDPKTNTYDPAAVLNYLKNLDKMEPKAKTQWLQFEKAIKEDRQETKLNNLVAKGYYMPTAFLKKSYTDQALSLKIRYVAPVLADIPDSTVKLTDEDYKKFYNENKGYFFQDEATRDLDFVLFEVTPSPTDRKKISDDVAQIYREFTVSKDVPDYVNANSDKKYDSAFVKKGKLTGMIDSLAFHSEEGTFFPPYEYNGAWYMGKLLKVQDRPDSIKASHILVSWQETRINQNIKRSKDDAKKLADSLLAILKKNPERLAELARSFSDYPTAKDDAGDLKWIPDGSPTFGLFFDKSMDMKTGDIKIIETGIGYSVFHLTERSALTKKVRVAVLQRNIEPSNQTYQDTYLKASSFAGQNRTADAFNRTAQQKGLDKKSSPGLREMDNYLMGVPSAREVVRWAYAETTKPGDVSPVFDLQGKYVVALLTNSYDKGLIPLEKVKSRIESNVRNQKKLEVLAGKMTAAFQTNKDLYSLATAFRTKVDTAVITFKGYSRASIGRDMKVVGKLFTLPKGIVTGPVSGRFDAYFVLIDDVIPAPPKEDFTYERMQLGQAFGSQVSNSLYTALQKSAVIKDDRVKFY